MLPRHLGCLNSVRREPVLVAHEHLVQRGERLAHLRNVKGRLGPARRRAEPVDDVADADAHLIV